MRCAFCDRNPCPYEEVNDGASVVREDDERGAPPVRVGDSD